MDLSTVRQPAPVYAACQSELLPSVFEEEEDDDEVDITMLKIVKKVMVKVLNRGDASPKPKPSSPKSFSPARLLTKTFPLRFSRFRTNSLNSSSSE
ncbi:hypothetical protein PGT21_016938 [Puccinia graminis f. sp. tritici]|uniref:Uncharacterized protein n=1 Tax=Puccinia graminis f. sp. tritici TaxID=56615 RepID=A0A5B0M782_PUCGR|nr:hypothetical protein PGT21_016938 [Puccinia graminis f. sp. tritici]